MKKQKLTPWFSGDVKPVHKGVYIASVGYGRFYRYWTGKKWTYGSYDSPDAALQHAKIMGMKKFPGINRWRGLAEKPA